MNDSFNEPNNPNNFLIGNIIQFGSSLLSEGIKAIALTISKNKELEIEKLKKEMIMMENKKKENDNRKQILELELKRKENDFLNNSILTFNYKKYLFNKEKMKEIYNNLINEINNIINELKMNNNFIEKIKQKILNLIKEKKEFLKETKKMNIYIMGITGVGKSCLKNSICNKNIAKENIGKRGTNVRFTYICDCHNFISITDNVGIELSYQNGIENIKEDTKNFIMEKINSNNEAIHCIWYCITGTRLQDSEYNLICDLRKLYKNNNIPIIIIYTQALEKEKYENMKNCLNEELRKNNNEEIGENPENIQFIPILAKTKTIDILIQNFEIKPFNISKLIEKTFNCFEYSRNLVNKKSIIELISSQIKNDYKKIYENCLEKIMIKNNYDEEEFIIFITTLISDFLSFNFENEQFLNLNQIIESIISIINENYQKFKSEKVLSLTNEIIKIEKDFCVQNSNENINLISSLKTEEILNEIIEIKINEKNKEQFKIYYFNEICKELFKELLSEVKTNILNFIETLIEKDEIIQKEIDSSINLTPINLSNGVNKLINELKEKEQ